ncbi:MAG: hypothetical protein D6696_11235 [Acidobacteria bacterium]|nr:MAG: hypothetical protein D6696_11235 [Acidobacteriota bacterium]
MRHRFNPDLGPGRVLAVEGRRVVVEFPERGETLHLAANSDALERLVLAPGSRARLESSGELVTIAGSDDDGRYRLEDGRRVSLDELWPVPEPTSPIDRLARGTIDHPEDVANRLDALRLKSLRQADGLGSFLGGRIELFPHQLYAAEQACRTDPVRWLLADEVGLGKTVEACLIMNRLIHTGRAERVLVVAPETLVVQWLGELWRKYHQVFVLLDDQRLKDVARDYGSEMSPFDVHRRVIVALELLVERPRLAEQAVAAGIDLLVVDEAHHLRRPPGHPGEPAYRAVAPIAALGRHVLLLTATPLEDDAHGFFRLLQLLRPDALPEDVSFDQRLASREPLPPCVSATRRADVGGLPPRRGRAVEIDDAAGWGALAELVEHLRRQPARNAAQRRRKAQRVARALASPAAVLPLLTAREKEARRLAAAADEADPRPRWLAEQAAGWMAAGEKALVFVAWRETLDRLKSHLERAGRTRVGIFHEDLSPERRDLEVAQFRLADGPAVLISTECGGEGRNFTFCDRLVLYDLPWHPAVVEQRIGRLDRIGRSKPTEILYFRPPAGLGRTVALLYERIGLFEQPLGGLERELRRVARAVEEQAVAGGGEVPISAFDGVLEAAREAHDRVRQAAYHELYREPYRPQMASRILARVPAELEQLTQRVVTRAAARLGLGIEPLRGIATYLTELGSNALVDHLPGVASGARFLGTFDRAEAVADETLDFFATGHPLVEGLLAELEDGDRGRVGLWQIAADEETFGLLALYLEGERLEAVAVDRSGPRPDLAERLLQPGCRHERVDARRWTEQRGWAKAIRRLAEALPEERRPQLVVAFRLRRA